MVFLREQFPAGQESAGMACRPASSPILINVISHTERFTNHLLKIIQTSSNNWKINTKQQHKDTINSALNVTLQITVHLQANMHGHSQTPISGKLFFGFLRLY